MKMKEFCNFKFYNFLLFLNFFSIGFLVLYLLWLIFIIALFRYMDKRAENYGEEEIPRTKHSSSSKKSKQSAKEVVNSGNDNPRFQQLIEDLNAFKSVIF